LAAAGIASHASAAHADSDIGKADRPLVNSKVADLFANFIGTCQAGSQIADVGKLAGMRWNRIDTGWNNLEPTEGEYNQSQWQKLDAQITASLEAGVTPLPILDYTAYWAGRKTSYSFVNGNKEYHYGAVKGESGSSWIRSVKIVNRTTGDVISDSDTKINKNFVPPADPAKWLGFVKKIVARYRSAPYNLQYFQIWNEAYPGSGFWTGGMDEYMTSIHIPAARAIQAAGGKAVYGGWPCGVSLNELVSLFDRHHAWPAVDVLDVHYDPLLAMDFLRKTSRNKRRGGLPVWQTETGFVTDTNLIPNLYAKAFHWALAEGLAEDPELAKLFWFAWSSPDDPSAYGYHCSLNNGTTRSDHGKTLATMGNLLGGNRVTTFSHFRTTPRLSAQLDERASGASGFRVGNRVVIAIHLARQGQANIFWDFEGNQTAWHLSGFDPELKIELPTVHRSAKLSRVDIFGNSVDLSWDPHSHQITVPVIEPNETTRATAGAAEVRTFYIVADGVNG
jgi:hypothetical protein